MLHSIKWDTMQTLLLLLLSFHVGLQAMEQQPSSIKEVKPFPGCSKFVMHVHNKKAVSIDVLTKKTNLSDKCHALVWKEYADRLDEVALLYNIAREPHYKNCGYEQKLIEYVTKFLFSRKIKYIAAQAKVRDDDALEIMQNTSPEQWHDMWLQENKKYTDVLKKCGFTTTIKIYSGSDLTGIFMHKVSS